jgi:hypothetical protein
VAGWLPHQNGSSVISVSSLLRHLQCRSSKRRPSLLNPRNSAAVPQNKKKKIKSNGSPLCWTRVLSFEIQQK